MMHFLRKWYNLNKPKPREGITMEQLLQTAGWGVYNYTIAIFCCLCTFVEATSWVTVTLLLPLITCDFKVSPDRVQVLNDIITAGVVVGSFLLGSASDILGRQPLIMFSLLCIFGSTLCCSFSSSINMFYITILILGFGIGGVSTILRVFLGETLPTSKRGSMLVTLDTVWSLGCILTLVITWLILPSLLASVNIRTRLMSWRVMISLSGLVPFVLLSCFNFVRDSPRVLLYRWKFALANDVLSVMYAINHSDFYTNFNKKKSVKHQNLEKCIEVDLGPDWIYIDNFPYLFIKIFKTIRKIFGWCFIRRFFPALVVSSTMFLSIFMAILWAVKMTRNVELSININSTWEGCNLTALDVLHIDAQFNPCFHTISTRVFLELLAGCSSVILGKIMLLLIGVVKIGRKVVLVVCLLVAASCSAAVYFTHSWWTSATLLYILLASYSAANTLFTILIVEIFPTGIRGTASGLLRSFHHLASILNTRYLWTSCEITLFSTAGMFLVSAFTCTLLPEMTGLPMAE